MDLEETMDPKGTFPARLHVVLARVGDKAVVFRRGPSKHVGTFLWDRRRDRFQLGQWFKGRIYERRSDLSPDGSHMIYFAMSGKRGSWTAVSQTPYLKALDLYAKAGCWEGGGLFTSSGKYWLNDRHFAERNVLRKLSRFLRDQTCKPEADYGAECTGVYYPRLLRDGWRLTERSQFGKWNTQSVFEKGLVKGWVLRKIAHEQVDAPPGRGCYWDEHALLNAGSQTRLTFPDWEWAEWDRRTLVWAEKGRLYRARLKGQTEIAPAKLLHDFNAERFEEVEAPY